MKSGIFKAVASMSASILGALAILSGAPAANASTYDVNFSFTDQSSDTITVTGNIVTTCDSCTLTGVNISTFSFSWNGPFSWLKLRNWSKRGRLSPQLVSIGRNNSVR